MPERHVPLITRHSEGISKVPNAGDIVLGELALNSADVILYASGTTSNSILPIGWDRIHRTGDTMTGDLIINADLTVTGTSDFNIVSATTYYGDGSNLTNIPDDFTTGATLIGTTAYFDRTDALSAYTLDLGSFTPTGDTYVTGGTFDKNSSTLTLKRNDDVDVSVTGITDIYTTGATVIDKTVYFDTTESLSAYTLNLSGFASNTRFVTVELPTGGVGKGGGYADEGILSDILTVALFDSSATETFLLSTIITDQVDLSTNPLLAFTLYNTDIPSAPNDTVYWEIDCRYLSVGDDLTGSPDETITGTTTFTGSSINTRQTTGIVTLDASLMSDGDIASFVVRRVPSNPADNYPADAAVNSAWLVYKEEDITTQ